MFSQNKSYLFLAVISVAVALYCYNPFALYFQNDDFIHIPLSAKGILLQHNTFRPVCDLSIAFDYLLWGKNAWGYHFTNLLLHIVACVILFFFIKLVITKYFLLGKSNVVPWVSAFLFFIYSSHSEATFWILGRSAVLAAIFSLFFLFCYLKRNESKKYIGGYILFFIVSLLTYESSWVLPLYCIMIGIIEIRIQNTNLKKESVHFLTLVLIFLVLLVVRYYYIHEMFGNYESGAFLNGNYFLLLKNYSELVSRSFSPPFLDNRKAIPCLVLFGAIIAIGLFKINRSDRRKLMVLSLFFLISLLPYSSLGIDTHGTEGERFLYFPTIIICLLYALVINLSALKNWWRFLFYAVLFTCHLIILLVNTNNYRFAGIINRSIVDELGKPIGKKTIYAIDLPQSQNGALIMRTGFPEMVKWMFNDKFDTAIVCSERSELQPLKVPYQIAYTSNFSTNCIGTNSVIDSSNSMVLRFTDSTLEISK